MFPILDQSNDSDTVLSCLVTVPQSEVVDPSYKVQQVLHRKEVTQTGKTCLTQRKRPRPGHGSCELGD